MNFGVRPAPLSADISLSDFMSWIEIEFKALLRLLLVLVILLQRFQSKVF
jgi:hypothetical protein